MALQTVTSIGVLSLAKMLAVLYAFLGLFFGAIMSLFAIMGAAGSAAAGGDSGAGLMGMIFGVGAIIIMPIFYGCLGFVGGIIMAPLYNLVAKIVGGIELELS